MVSILFPPGLGLFCSSVVGVVIPDTSPSLRFELVAGVLILGCFDACCWSLEVFSDNFLFDACDRHLELFLCFIKVLFDDSS